ncbi:uncharacterized protein LOC116257450 isoform X2 [Nymphaea colorata]|uniref:uncharacterized protein LOC116257450 isoform X2 n=1 Tax=Nymphaea colorata TaxID=210225 RepID=UPI00129E78EA|nr:uncharacterized protein LOC116257450 isoform X2 [Nymphaea colorata]
MNSFSLSSCRPLIPCDSSRLIGRRDSVLSGPCSAGRIEISTPNVRRPWRILAVGEVAEAASNPVRAEITWQIVVGALAGVTPFMVAGVEFSKRIIAQRRCGVCGGSGLVLREKNYFRCPGCGGFLPWQSWRRFFSG